MDESAEFFGSPKLREISALEKISGDKVGENFIQKGVAYHYLAGHHLVDCDLKTKGSLDVLIFFNFDENRNSSYLR